MCNARILMIPQYTSKGVKIEQLNFNSLLFKYTRKGDIKFEQLDFSLPSLVSSYTIYFTSFTKIFKKKNKIEQKGFNSPLPVLIEF